MIGSRSLALGYAEASPSRSRPLARQEQARRRPRRDACSGTRSRPPCSDLSRDCMSCDCACLAKMLGQGSLDVGHGQPGSVCKSTRTHSVAVGIECASEVECLPQIVVKEVPVKSQGCRRGDGDPSSVASATDWRPARSRGSASMAQRM
jgi:hypothetical protein